MSEFEAKVKAMAETQANIEAGALPQRFICGVEYATVKVIVTAGDEQVVYDLPRVVKFAVETRYEEPPVPSYRDAFRPAKATPLEFLAFTMRPEVETEGGNLFTVTKSKVAP